MLVGLAVVLVTSALRRTAAVAGSPALGARARRVQAVAVLAGAVLAGTILALIESAAARHAASNGAGPLVLVGLVMLAIGLGIALPIAFVSLLGVARAAVATAGRD
jgi:hypothetical protein